MYVQRKREIAWSEVGFEREEDEGLELTNPSNRSKGWLFLCSSKTEVKTESSLIKTVSLNRYLEELGGVQRSPGRAIVLLITFFCFKDESLMKSFRPSLDFGESILL